MEGSQRTPRSAQVPLERGAGRPGTALRLPSATAGQQSLCSEDEGRGGTAGKPCDKGGAGSVPAGKGLGPGNLRARKQKTLPEAGEPGLLLQV